MNRREVPMQSHRARQFLFPIRSLPPAVTGALILVAAACSDPLEPALPMASAELSSVPTELRAQYNDDAARLALRMMAAEGPLEDQPVIIPRGLHRDLFRALVHVHNAHHLPARDTVVDVVPMRTFPDINTDRISVGLDERAGWPRRWRNGNVGTGRASLDWLIARYSLKVVRYSGYQSGHNTWATLRAAEPLNAPALAQQFVGHEGVRWAESHGAEGNSIDIRAFRAPGWSWILEYSLPWHHSLGRRCGGWERSCNRLRTWSFRVLPSGDVLYLGATGDDFPNFLY